MKDADQGTVHQQVDGAVLTATLDAFAWRNSMGAPGVREALNAAQQRFEADESLRVMVLTGANGVFSAGGNLDQLREIRDEAQMLERLQRGAPFLATMLKSGKLYVAAIEGPAFGAALGVAMGCDLVVAAEGARFCAAQVRVGASPDGGLFWTLPLRVGVARARRILLTGEEVDLASAHAMGMVDQVSAKGGALADAQKLALRLSKGPPLPQATIKAFFADYPTSLEGVLELERRTAARNFVSEDFLEGASAFLEKRKAQFRGR
ncbi:MAG: enoyl-CoA hydratase/isomerase family protein [Burkholderiaceae bacterium]